MGDYENAMGFQHGNESIPPCPFSSVSMVEPSSDVVANPVLPSSAWDPLVSLSQARTFGGSSMVTHNEFANSSSYPLVLENQGMSSNSHLVQYMSDSNFDMVPKVPSYGSGSYSEMIASFGQPVSAPVNAEQSQVEDSTFEEGAPGSAPSGNRRKRGLDYNSSLSPNKNTEGNAMKDSPGKSSDGLKEHEKKPKFGQNTGADLRGKQLVKQAKDNSQSGEATKENFIHVRARRGQATNSHSLAERVRREKISERMRLLQELVPGCSKITGKAVMLDEIINYVQSLQQQVEFLSMKLATVNPELNFDVKRILSRDILQSRIGHGIGAYGPGISSSHPFASGSFQGTLGGMPGASAVFPPLPQTVLDHEFQSFYGMGFDLSATLDNLGSSGRLKTEL